MKDLTIHKNFQVISSSASADGKFAEVTGQILGKDRQVIASVDLLRRQRAPHWLASQVRDPEGEILWDYRKDQPGVNVLVKLVVDERLTQDFCLAFQSKKSGRKKLKRVVPVSAIGQTNRISLPNGEVLETIPGYNMKEVYQLKLRIAKVLGDETGASAAITSHEKKIARALGDSQKKKKEVAGERRRKKREEILSRKQAVAFSEDGYKKYGTPVVGNEWQCLPEGTKAVAVKDLDSMEPVEAFVVRRRGGDDKAQKKWASSVTKERQQQKNQEPETPAPTAIVYGCIGENPFEEVFVFGSSKIKDLAGIGLSFVSVGGPDKNGKYKVFSARNGSDYEAVGMVSPEAICPITTEAETVQP